MANDNDRAKAQRCLTYKRSETTLKAFDDALSKRGESPHSEILLSIDKKRREHQGQLQELQEQRNKASKLIGEAKASGDNESAERAIAEVSQLKSKLQEGEEEAKRLTEQLADAMSGISNIALDDVPVGTDESANVVYREKGKKPKFEFRSETAFRFRRGHRSNGF